MEEGYSSAIPPGFEKKWSRYSAAKKRQIRANHAAQERKKAADKANEDKELEKAKKGKKKQEKKKPVIKNTSPSTSKRSDYKDLM